MDSAGSSLRLITSTGDVFVVEKSVAMKLKYVKYMINTVEITSENDIPVGHIENHILEAIFRFVTYNIYMEDSPVHRWNDIEIADWKRNFVKMDDSSLLKLIEATYYLDVPELYDLACERRSVVEIVKKLKTSRAIRERFNIQND